jgi:hypothetical protein
MDTLRLSWGPRLEGLCNGADAFQRSVYGRYRRDEAVWRRTPDPVSIYTAKRTWIAALLFLLLRDQARKMARKTGGLNECKECPGPNPIDKILITSAAVVSDMNGVAVA